MRLRKLCCLGLILAFSFFSFAQSVDNGSNGGTPENAVFHGSDLDAVQTNNGSLQIVIPLSDTPGRDISSGWRYVYNNKGWHAQSFHDGASAIVQPNLGNSMAWRLVGPIPSAASLATKVVTQACGTTPGAARVFTVVEADGTRHHMVPDPTEAAGGFCNWNDFVDHYADDGSGWFLKGGTALYRKDGVLMGGAVTTTGGNSPQDIVNVPPKIIDPNGNQAYGTMNGSVITYTDSLGRAIPAVTTVTDGSGKVISQQIPYYDASGVLRTIQVQMTSINVVTHLCPVTECTEYGGTWQVPQTITLANGLFYSFSYDPVTGELTSMTLPSGARIDYSYAQQFYGATTDTGGRSVISRKMTTGGQSYLWNYSYSLSNISPAATTTVVDPIQNQTVYQCVPMGLASDTTWDQLPCYTTDLNSYAGNGSGATLLRTIHTDYWPSTTTPKPKAITTTTYTTIAGDTSVLRSRLETDYQTFPAMTSISTGNVTETREYSYDSAGNNPVLVRRSRLTYLSDSNAQYLSANITDRITDKSVYDCVASACTAPSSVGPYGTPYSGGKLVAEIKYAYDGSAVVNPDNLAAPPASVPGHDDADYGTGFTLRGNLTQTSVWLNTSNSWLPTSNVYDALGHLVSTTDPGGHTTTLRYSDDWNGWSANSACLPSSNSFAFLTDTTNAKGQHSHTTYFPCTGQVQTSKDQNDLNTARAGTTFTYDLMKRLKAKTASDGGSTTFDYADTIGALNATETTKITSSLSEMVKTGYDDLGRVAHTYLQSDPDGVTTTDITYDELGRKKTVSNPYRSTSDSTYGITTTVYDALGRVTTVIPPGGSPTANNLSTQYGGNYTISTDQAGHQRKRYFDSLGRVIEVDEPSSAFPGAEAGGSVNISGTLQGGLFGNHAASPGVGSVTISGLENVNCINNRCTPDRGAVFITVNGHADSTSFAGASTSATIASALKTNINGDVAAFVNASCDDSTCSNGFVRLQARNGGAATNYPLSCSVTQQQGSFDCTPSGTALSGGLDAAAGTYVYDAGSVTLSLASYSATANYGNAAGQDSTASGVAADLVTKIQAQLPVSNPPFSIDVPQNGTTISVGWNTPTAAGNVTVTTTSSTSQTAYFSAPSFGGCGQPTTNPQTCSTSLAGGADPGPSDLSNPYVTLYSYDALNNLLQVQQKGGTADSTQWRERSFQYDSLSRLTQSTNPETGVISFTYDSDGLLQTKTSPLPNQTGASTVTITYAYDELHRHTGRTYSNGDPAISYAYDAPDGSLVNGLTVHNGIGRRTSMTDGSGSAAFSYDSEGRLSAERKNIGTTSAISKNVSYTYNLDGSLATIGYPSGSTITYTPAQNGGSAGREGMVQDLAHGINYVTGATGPGSYATYAPDGSVATFNNGYAAGFSGISNTFSYNSRLQPIAIQAVSPGATVFSIGYDFHLSNGDNGNVYQVTNYKDNSRSQIFTYDQLNRLTSGKTSASTLWGDNYSYDPWGNLTQKTPMAGAQQAENFSQTVLSNNRIASLAYDAAGNTTNDGVNTYTYDAENQIVSAAGVTYTYDGDGARVKKSNGRLYWYGAPGIVAESDLSGNLTAEYIFFDGERVARRDLPSGTVHYYFSDHLKSVSVVTSAAGVIEEESDYHPWGEERIITHTLADQHFKFNGKERDTETGFDEFGARLYNSAWSRWLTPDWSADPTPVPYAQMDNPQSLNLYEYALNNPTTFPDLDGHLAAGGSAVSGSGGFSADCGYTCQAGGGSPQQLAQQTQGAATRQFQFTATGALIGGTVGALVGGTIGAIGGAAGGAAGGTLVAPGPGTIVGGVAGGVGGGSVGAGEGAAIGASVGAFVGGSIGYVWSLFSSKSDPPNPYGSSGAPDHQAKVGELIDKANGEAKSGESVESNTRVKGIPSSRRPDAQIISKGGKTRKVFEAERHPNRQRNQKREQEYQKLRLPNETHPLDK